MHAPSFKELSVKLGVDVRVCGARHVHGAQLGDYGIAQPSDVRVARALALIISEGIEAELDHTRILGNEFVHDLADPKASGPHLRDPVHGTLWVAHASKGGFVFHPFAVRILLMCSVSELHTRHDCVGSIFFVVAFGTLK